MQEPGRIPWAEYAAAAGLPADSPFAQCTTGRVDVLGLVRWWPSLANAWDPHAPAWQNEGRAFATATHQSPDIAHTIAFLAGLSELLLGAHPAPETVAEVRSCLSALGPAAEIQSQLGARTDAHRRQQRAALARDWDRVRAAYDALPQGLLAPAISAQWRHLSGVATWTSLLPAEAEHTDVHGAIAAATAWLERHGFHAEEHQAFGLPGHPEPLTERRWLHMRVALAIQRAGGSTSPLQALLDHLPSGLPRWYNDWDGIPPDTDSLGTALEAAFAVGDTDRIHRLWDELTRAAAVDRPTPTWLSDGPPRWGGPGCAAVRLRFVRALLETAGSEQHPVLWANLDDMLAHPLLPRVFHYPTARVAGFALDAARIGIESNLSEPWASRVHDWLRALLQQVQADWPDRGPWRSVEGTAALLPTLARKRPHDARTHQAVRRVVAAQLPDGSWPAEPAFVIPGRPPAASTWFHSRALTTATCLEGLASARATWPRGCSRAT